MKYLMVIMCCCMIPLVGMPREIEKNSLKSVIWNIGQQIEHPGSILTLLPQKYQLVVIKNREKEHVIGCVEKVIEEGDWHGFMIATCMISFGDDSLPYDFDDLRHLPDDQIIILTQ